MKCQHCEKPATFHITELTGPELLELHLCEDHARQYLTPAEAEPSEVSSSLTESLTKQLKIGQTAEELARLDQRVCPVCGISFYEFRNVGRLGCPHDYVCFDAELEPLIVNIHGATRHVGKQPKRQSGDSDWQTELIRLRRELHEAIEDERYERASELRDEIKRIEGLVASGGRPE
ncbi:MAG: UvrB/UvrC motif-containing protein [Planctomycetales bacterium]|nr:UvrB/UvrC motif-containing protein [Planctomycetales bacterium]